ncbi:hypothetical protein HDU98_007516 [Podochytrium sp. JEL0797]|nr:hypothetical protein HDU98_007516 [Podochytrium sp. JEL0797]
MTNFVTFNAANNKLTGTIPTSFWLSRVGTLQLNNNQLNGSLVVPPNYTQNNLNRLELQNNTLTGSLANLASSMMSLRYIDVSNNRFVGAIPTNLQASSVNLDNNFFSGASPNTNYPTAMNCLTSQNGTLDANLGCCSTGTLGDTNNCGSCGSPCLGFGHNCINNQCQVTNVAECYSIADAFPNIFDGSLDCCVTANSFVQVDCLPAFQSSVVAVVALNMGSVPVTIGALGNMTHLASLRFQFTNGSIPTEIGLITSLTNLELDENTGSPVGPFPTEIGMLTNLITLSVAANLSGVIPTEIGHLTKLESLTVTKADFSALGQTLPTQIGLMASLTTLTLASSGISGLIPTQLGNLAALQSVDLSYNSLSGSIPSQLSNCVSLNNLNLGFNQLSGSIPDALLAMPMLPFNKYRVFYLNNNNLMGPVHVSSNTQYSLSLQNNLLSGLSNSLITNATFNCFQGVAPSQLNPLCCGGICTGFGKLCSNNVCLVTNMTSCAVFSGVFAGVNATSDCCVFSYSGVASAICGQAVNSTSNDIVAININSGTIPTTIGLLNQLPNLQSITAYPLVNGTVPTQIGALAGLKTLRLQTSNSGPIPTEIGKMTSLVSLFIGFNKMGGSIPTEIGMMSQLLSITISGAGFNGSLPTQLGLLTKLQQLYIYDTQITGSIPPQLGINQQTSATFFLSFNRLTGPMPTLPFNNQTVTLTVEHNFLSSAPFEGLPGFQGKIGNVTVHGLWNCVAGELNTANENPNCCTNGTLGDHNNCGTCGTNCTGTCSNNACVSPSTTSTLLSVSSRPFTGIASSTNTFMQSTASATESASVVNHDCATIVSSFSSYNFGIDCSTLVLNVTIPLNPSSSSSRRKKRRGTGGAFLQFVNGRAVQAVFANLGITGSIPASLGSLSALSNLDFSGCALSGPIPSALGQLTALTNLNFAGNALTGGIPPALAQCTLLQNLDLSGNSLSGPIPAALAALTNLKSISLVGNSGLTGSLPPALVAIIINSGGTVKTGSPEANKLVNCGSISQDGTFANAEYEPYWIAYLNGQDLESMFKNSGNFAEPDYWLQRFESYARDLSWCLKYRPGLPYAFQLA